VNEARRDYADVYAVWKENDGRVIEKGNKRRQRTCKSEEKNEINLKTGRDKPATKLNGYQERTLERTEEECKDEDVKDEDRRKKEKKGFSPHTNEFSHRPVRVKAY